MMSMKKTLYCTIRARFEPEDNETMEEAKERLQRILDSILEMSKIVEVEETEEE